MDGAEREPGLYAIAYERQTQTPRWWPRLLRWDGTAWLNLDGTPWIITRPPDWIGPRIYPGYTDPREARIAALEAQIARLTAPFGPEDAEVVYRVNGAWIENVHPDYAEALFTAFLERRMKG